MMAPLQAPGALKETHMGFGTNNTAVLAGYRNKLANESLCEGPTDHVMDISPDSTSV
jgi:hypothetical protein